MKVLELYSGIGGMHLALKESGVNGEVIASIEINPTANAVYKHNFLYTTLLNRNIEGLTSDFINKLNVDTILMSPPCQPFTRNGNQLDVDDERTNSFQHLVNILHELKVKYILIENVKGFEKSTMRNNLTEKLIECNFNYQEFILTPTQFGIPNTRHRYYCLAKKKPLTFSFATGPLLNQLPLQESKQILFEISSIIQSNGDLESYKLSDKILEKYANTLDICYSSSTRSCCFTKAYGRYVQGTGSVYCEKSLEDVDYAYNVKNKELQYLKSLNLRFFTPLEVSKLMSFPSYFQFPSDITDKQKYMLLGNSINVKVVSELIKVLYEYLFYFIKIVI